MGSSKRHNNKDPEQLPDLQPQEDEPSASENREDVGETSVFYARPFEDEQDHELRADFNKFSDPGNLEFDLDTINSEQPNEGKFVTYGDMIVYQDQLNYPDINDYETDSPADKVSLTLEQGAQVQSEVNEDRGGNKGPIVPNEAADNPKTDQELAQELEYLLNQFGPIEVSDESDLEPAKTVDQNQKADPDEDELKTFLKSKLISNPGDWPLHESDQLDGPYEKTANSTEDTRENLRQVKTSRSKDLTQKAPLRSKVSTRVHDSESVRLPTDDQIFPAESDKHDTWAPKTEFEATDQVIHRRTWTKKAALLLLAVIGVILWLAGNDHYEAQSDLLFVPEKMSEGQTTNWSLDKEASALKSSGLLYAFSEAMFSGNSNNNRFGSERLTKTYKANFKSEGKFIKWLSQNMSVTAHNNRGFVSLSLTGDDPLFLKGILDSYVGFYSYYRPEMIQEEMNLSKLQEQSPGKINAPELENIEKRQLKLNSQIQETQLALNMMKSGNGPFRGFLASDNAAKIPSIASFQSKIVELELKKKELEVRYRKGSRELRSINEQMDGVRRAMMECVAERIRFLKIKADQLERTRKNMLAKANTAAKKSPAKKVQKQPLVAGDLNIPGSREKAPKIGDGLYLVETAHIVKIPAKERLRNLFKYLAGYTGASANQWSVSWKKTLTSYPFTSDVPGWDKKWEDAAGSSSDGKDRSAGATGNGQRQDSRQGFKNIW